MPDSCAASGSRASGRSPHLGCAAEGWAAGSGPIFVSVVAAGVTSAEPSALVMGQLCWCAPGLQHPLAARVSRHKRGVPLGGHVMWRRACHRAAGRGVSNPPQPAPAHAQLPPLPPTRACCHRTLAPLAGIGDALTERRPQNVYGSRQRHRTGRHPCLGAGGAGRVPCRSPRVPLLPRRFDRRRLPPGKRLRAEEPGPPGRAFDGEINEPRSTWALVAAGPASLPPTAAGAGGFQTPLPFGHPSPSPASVSPTILVWGGTPGPRRLGPAGFSLTRPHSF